MTGISAPTAIEAIPADAQAEVQPLPAPRRSAAHGFENGRYPCSDRMGQRAYETEKRQPRSRRDMPAKETQRPSASQHNSPFYEDCKAGSDIATILAAAAFGRIDPAMGRREKHAGLIQVNADCPRAPYEDARETGAIPDVRPSTGPAQPFCQA